MSSYHTEQKKLLLDFLTKNKDRSFTIDEITAGLVEKEAGRYVSVSFGSTENMDGEAFEEIARVTSDELGKLILRVTGGKQSPKILVAGLGNEGF